MISDRGLSTRAPQSTVMLRPSRLTSYRDKFANPYNAAELGYIDEVIDPARTRPRLIEVLDACRNRRDRNPPRKHGNIPL